MSDPADATRTAGPGRSADGPTRLLDPSATADDPSALSPAPGSLPAVPGYEVLGVLGRGGMGVVYKARQVALNRLVAVKFLPDGPAASAGRLVRFRQEAEAVARLQHPNIVQVFEVGAAPGGAFLALEYVDGGTLQQQTAGVPQPPREAARVVETVARAVHHAHEHRIVHRDLKPGNILLTAGGVPKVADFGLARFLDAGVGLTQTTEFAGTPAYSAPEQVQNRAAAIGPATDVYALGAVLYELLAGRRPFAAGSVPEVLRAVVERDPVPPRRLVRDVPRDLETVALKCLEKEPSKRYASAAELADDLRRFLAGEPVTARPVGRVGRLARWARRHPDLAALFGLVVGLLTAVAAVAVVSAVRIDDARHQADRDAGAARTALANEQAARAEAVEAAERAARAEADRDRQADRTRGAVTALLDEAEDALKGDRPREAALALGQAGKRLGADAPDDLRGRLAGLGRDFALAAELDRIRDQRWKLTDDRLDPAGAAAAYRAAFAGLGLGAAPPAEVAARVRAAPTAARQTDGLADWLADTRDRAERAALAAVLAVLDPDPTAVEVRAAFAAGNAARLARLAGEADGAALRPGFAAWLGSRPEVPLDRAAKLFRAAVRTHPADYPLLYSAGRRVQGHFNDEAVGYYRAAVAVRPDNPLAWNDLAGTYHDKGDFPAAAAHWAEALKRDPSSAWINLNLAFVHLRLGRRDPALAHAREAVRLKPDNYEAHDAVGRVLEARGDTAGAAAAYREAVRQRLPAAGPAAALGWALVRLNDPAGAEPAFRTAVRLGPDNPDHWVWLATVLLAQGEEPEAVAVLRRGLSTHPRWAVDPTHPLWYWVARVVLRGGAGVGVRTPPPADRPKARAEARQILAAAAAAYRGRLDRGPARHRAEVAARTAEWLADDVFAPVRHPFRLAALPADEAAAWARLWADVRALRDAAGLPAGKANP